MNMLLLIGAHFPPSFPRLSASFISRFCFFCCYYLRFNKYVYCTSDTLVKCYAPSQAALPLRFPIPDLLALGPFGLLSRYDLLRGSTRSRSLSISLLLRLNCTGKSRRALAINTVMLMYIVAIYISAMIYSLYLSLCIWLNNFHGQLPTVRHKLPQITAERQQPNPYNEIKIHSQIKRGKKEGRKEGKRRRRRAGAQDKVKMKSNNNNIDFTLTSL